MATIMGEGVNRGPLTFNMTPGTRALDFVCSGTRESPHDEEPLCLASLSDDDDRGLVFTFLERKYRSDRAEPGGRSGFVSIVDEAAGTGRWLLNATCGHLLEGGRRCRQNPQLTAEVVIKIIEAGAAYGSVRSFNVSNIC